jgi:hypothetical protein
MTVTTGTNNTLIGSLAGDAITTADNNTAVGYASLGATTTGLRNAVLGNNAFIDKHHRRCKHSLLAIAHCTQTLQHLTIQQSVIML